MHTLSILSQKGGTGKTTLALHLAVAAEQAGKPTAVIDLDPQASAASWGDQRDEAGPVVISAPPTRLAAILATAEREGAELAIIDTAPHSESAALAAARASDLILIPCRPAILDIRAIGTTTNLAQLAAKPAVVILNAVPPRGTLAQEAEAAVEAYGIPVTSVRIGHRAAFFHSLTLGKTAQEYEPQGKAALEIEALYSWLARELGL